MIFSWSNTFIPRNQTTEVPAGRYFGHMESTISGMPQTLINFPKPYAKLNGQPAVKKIFHNWIGGINNICSRFSVPIRGYPSSFYPIR